MAIWTPQPGPQVRAATCPANAVLFGGTRGGGKSDCLIGRHIRGAELYKEYWSGLIFRRKYKDFAEIRKRWGQLKRAGLPIDIIGGDQQPTRIKFTSSAKAHGAEIGMFAISRLDMLDDFQGHQYPEVSVDEAPNFPFFLKMIDKIRGFNRSPHGVPKGIFCTGNPGGAGHNQVKEYFKLGKHHGIPPNTVQRYQIKMLDGTVREETRIFIQSFLSDNRYLVENDPEYVASLSAIQDPQLRKAWLEGDWDVFIGQAFNFTEDYHIIPACDPPRGAPIYMTFDWGYGKPFSVGWWFVDADGRVIRFAEWYGWNGAPDEGLRLEDSKIADGILERERNFGLNGVNIIRLAGPDCFSKKPDYRGGGQGPSTAEVFGLKGVHVMPGDPSRELKIRQFRERLSLLPGERPMLQVAANCKQFIRTIPSLCMDEEHPEDIDTDQEDHIYDEACHICMARPMTLINPKPKLSSTDKRIDALYKEERDDFVASAEQNALDAMRDMGLDYDYDVEEVDDGAVTSTI